MNCINFCEILSKDLSENNIIDKTIDALQHSDSYERVYVGSYFCSQYFLKADFDSIIKTICNKYKFKVTLVVPIISQKDLVLVKKRIDKIINSVYELDEITVNDIGMLYYIHEHYQDMKINLGRLFFKEAREPRISGYYESHQVRPAFLSVYDKVVGDIPINYFELDITNKNILHDGFNKRMGLHTPLCYMTTGNICKFASIHKDIKDKFRPNLKCSMECMNIYENLYDEFKAARVNMYRIGRTIYFQTDQPEDIKEVFGRVIYFPFFEIIDYMRG